MKKRKKAGILRQNAISEIREERFAALAANFTHLMALLLWAGGLIAFMEGYPSGHSNLVGESDQPNFQLLAGTQS